MKEEALQVALKQRSDSPCLVSNKKEYETMVKDYVLKDIASKLEYNQDPKFVRKTRMGGHMSNTLKKAGLNNLGLLMGPFDDLEHSQMLGGPQHDSDFLINEQSE